MVIRRWRRGEAALTLTLQQPLVIVLSGVALVVYALWPRAETAMLAAGLFGLLGCAAGWVLLIGHPLRVERRLESAAVQVGDEVAEHLFLDNPAPLPAWLEVRDETTLGAYSLNGVQAVDAASVRHWRAKGICQRRGIYRLGPWSVQVRDPFGLFLLRATYPASHDLVVYPPLARLPFHLVPAPAALGDRRMMRTPYPVETINAMTTRAYVPGDPLRHVHWPTTARRADLYVRAFQPEAASTFWLMPDFDQAAQLGTGDDSTEETLVLLCVGLAQALLRDQRAVGLVTLAPELLHLHPANSPAQIWPILRALAAASPAPVPTSDLVARVAPLLSRRSTVLVLSANLQADWLTLLRTLQRAQSGAELFALDRASFGGQGQAAPLVQHLATHGVHAHAIARGDVTPITAGYGALRRWEFMTLGTGRVVVRQSPRATAETMKGGR